MKKTVWAALTAMSFAALPVIAANFTATVDSSCGGGICVDSDLHVTVTVLDGCSALHVEDIDFGSFAPQNLDVDVPTNLFVTCNNAQPYTIELDYGVNTANGNSTQRQVANADSGEFIDYSLFQPDGSTPWGLVAAEGPTAALSGTGTGAEQTFIVNGTLRLLDTKSPGTYTDLVTAILNF